MLYRTLTSRSCLGLFNDACCLGSVDTFFLGGYKTGSTFLAWILLTTVAMYVGGGGDGAGTGFGEDLTSDGGAGEWTGGFDAGEQDWWDGDPATDCMPLSGDTFDTEQSNRMYASNSGMDSLLLWLVLADCTAADVADGGFAISFGGLPRFLLGTSVFIVLILLFIFPDSPFDFILPDDVLLTPFDFDNCSVFSTNCCKRADEYPT